MSSSVPRRLDDLLAAVKLERYKDALEAKGIQLATFLATDEKGAMALADSVGMKSGHKMRLRRALDTAIEEKWIPAMSLPQLQRSKSAELFESTISRKVPYEAFRQATLSNDAKAITAFMRVYRPETKAIRHFIKERLLVHSGQSLRKLRESDVDTLLLLHEMYTDPSKFKSKNQPLPFEAKEENFARHLLEVEATVKGTRQVWTVEDPAPIVCGFETRRDAYKALARCAPGTCFFRLSNSKPNKLAFCYRDQKKMAQKLVDAFKTIDDVRAFIIGQSKSTELTFRIRNRDTGVTKDILSILDMVETPEYDTYLAEHFNFFMLSYAAQKQKRRRFQSTTLSAGMVAAVTLKSDANQGDKKKT